MKRKPAHDPNANRRYHDRVAGKYDGIYTGPRWDAWYEISWAGLKPHLPRDLRAPIVDLGCGTGKYGLRIARSGYAVTLSDLSHGMLEAARNNASAMNLGDRAQFVQADIMDLGALPREHFMLAVAQGDVLSFATHPPAALKEIRKLLAPGGVLVASVDQTYAAIAHYCEKPDLAGLEKLLRHGEMEWLARDHGERFPVHTFSAEELRALLERGGFEVLDLFGKTVLPFKKLEAAFQDAAQAQLVLDLEKRLCREKSALGLASHLQFAARVK